MKRSPLSRVGVLGLSSFQRLAKPEQKPAKGPRKSKCKACRTLFVPDRPFVKWCSPECGSQIGQTRLAKLKAKQAKAERSADKIKKEACQEPKWFKAKAKKALHAFIRARDEGKPCISCDTILVKQGRVGGDYDAGHFRSVGSAKHLEFEEKNIFGQCKHCNMHLQGNHLEYERRLRVLMGDEYVDEILSDQAPRHLGISEYQAIEATYKAKLKALKSAQCLAES